MMMKKTQRLIFITLAFFMGSNAMADGFSWHGSLGYAVPKFSNSTSDVWMNQYMENQYSIASTSHSDPLFGAGLAYEWNFKKNAINLGVSAYYLHTKVGGVNTPFVNSPGLNAPTLDYNVSGNSMAMMLEPKFILTTYRLQPYALVGAGIAVNRFSGYAETPSVPGSGASPTQSPFGSHTSTNVAFESGIGIQYALSHHANAPQLALDYRYMNWGTARLGDAEGTSNTYLNFGKLSTQTATLSLIYPF